MKRRSAAHTTAKGRATLQRAAIVAVAAICVVTATVVSYAGEAKTLETIIADYLNGRSAEVQLAPDHQLARRYAFDMTGVAPTADDLQQTKGMSPPEMFDYFINKGQLAHTAGEHAYVWINLLKDADHFLFSNSTQFSQVAHIQQFRDELRKCYATGSSFQELARWALTSQMFLNRFPSAADRANAAFFLFLGRDSLSSEVPAGDMWNGFALVDPGALPGNANYHVYDYDPVRCVDGTTVCNAVLWSHEGSTPEEAIELIVSSSMFTEATVRRYWERAIGSPLPLVEFPDVLAVLARDFVKSGYNLNWLLRELMTSPAYTQEMMFR